MAFKDHPLPLRVRPHLGTGCVEVRCAFASRVHGLNGEDISISLVFSLIANSVIFAILCLCAPSSLSTIPFHSLVCITRSTNRPDANVALSTYNPQSRLTFLRLMFYHKQHSSLSHRSRINHPTYSVFRVRSQLYVLSTYGRRPASRARSGEPSAFLGVPR